MNTTEVRLEYQKETGLGLTTINEAADAINNQEPAENENTQEYIKWLEEKIVSLVKHGQHLLDSSQPHLY